MWNVVISDTRLRAGKASVISIEGEQVVLSG